MNVEANTFDDRKIHKNGVPINSDLFFIVDFIPYEFVSLIVFCRSGHVGFGDVGIVSVGIHYTLCM